MGAQKEKRASYHQGVRVTHLLDPFSPQVFLFLREGQLPYERVWFSAGEQAPCPLKPLLLQMFKTSMCKSKLQSRVNNDNKANGGGGVCM